ncbi:MAG: NUDIX domain-containing protein, partial [Thermoplasmata archaeon]|nr:NUDIX domain-containing protein [Thermoplasmata archaeon]
ICVFRRGDAIFVMEGYDSLKDEVFYRPLGGEIEFGEKARDTVIRELREEISAEVTNLRFLEAVENLFTLEGEPGHEIVLIFEGDFVDSSFYEREALEGKEEDEVPFVASWKPLDVFRRGEHPLYPDELLDLLDGREDSRPDAPH